MSKSWDDNDIMTLNPHRGVKMQDVPDDYLKWLWDQTWFTAKSHPGLYEYVKLALGKKDDDE